MEMSEREIYKSWKDSKKPKTQLKILAELNDTKPKIIQEIILRQQVLEKQQSNEISKKPKNVDFTQSEENMNGFEEITNRLDVLDALISKYTKEYITLAHKLCSGMI